MPITSHLKVCGFHIDVFGHVNNARYLEFMEIARWELIQQTQLIPLLEKNNWGMSIVNININYRQAAFLGDELTIVTDIKKVGTKSVTSSQIIYRNGDELICDAEVIFVMLDKNTGKSLTVAESMGPLLAK